MQRSNSNVLRLTRKRSMTNKLLFVRIGWMKYYDGPQVDDERPIGGGKYNKKNTGGEVFAFKNVKGYLYGAFAVKSFDTGLRLERIESGVRGDRIRGVRVIFFARDRFSGVKKQVIVGWYNGATLTRYTEEKPWWHFATTKAANSVLLPMDERTCHIPRGENTPGQSNIFYVLKGPGSPKSLPWLKNVCRFVDTYPGPNLLNKSSLRTEPQVELARENALAVSLGQGVIIDSSERKAIENLAMNEAVKYFRKKGFSVTDVHATESYDLRCEKGRKLLKVEVKGTQTLGQSITLTPNEVKLGKRGENMVLFVRHSVKVTKHRRRIRASGGKNFVILPWKIDSQKLRVVAYAYST